jgi:hypothetical protein
MKSPLAHPTSRLPVFYVTPRLTAISGKRFED